MFNYLSLKDINEFMSLRQVKEDFGFSGLFIVPLKEEGLQTGWWKRNLRDFQTQCLHYFHNISVTKTMSHIAIPQTGYCKGSASRFSLWSLENAMPLT